MTVGPVAVLDFVVDKTEIDQPGHLTQRVIRAHSIIQTHIQTEELLWGRVFKTHHEGNLRRIQD